jgi:Ni/Fe-hydrogenase subunit HybB-like protein
LHLRPFLLSSLRSATTGGRRYHLWMGTLTAIILVGAYAYSVQWRYGLAVTGMTDQVSWGLYISNFTFLVGMAAAAMMLVLPAYILEDVDFSKAVLMAEAVAVAALVMALGFVVVDLGNPQGSWHLTPVIGYLNWPRSLLSWDVIVLNGYLALNLFIPFYILYSHYTGQAASKKKYLPWMYISAMWAVSIHLVTAFLLAGLPSRPFWNTALLGPRFLASAFTAGPALVMLFSELFAEFYSQTHHSIHAQYLFLGLHGHNALVPWIWTGISLNITATIVLMIHPFRRNPRWLMPACATLFAGIWIEKGIGLVIPGFIPSPLGEIVEYTPTWVELCVTAGIWALGLFVMTVLVKVALPIELGEVRSPNIDQPAGTRVVRPRTVRPRYEEVRPARTR